MVILNPLTMLVIMLSIFELSFAIPAWNFNLLPPKKSNLTDDLQRIPASLRGLASRIIHPFASTLFCSHVPCTMGKGYFDPIVEQCYCPWAPAQVMTETFLQPDRECRKTNRCGHPYKSVHDNNTMECTCSITSLPPWGRKYDIGYDPLTTEVVAEASRALWSYLDMPGKKKGFRKPTVTISHRKDRRQQTTTSGAVSQAPTFSYVPPPPIDVTNALLQMSMAVQPQKVAIVASVIPHFADGVITFFTQLQGPIAQALVINATDTLPCDSIGAQQQPSIIVVPRSVNNGAPGITIPTCLIIAVNTYDPRWITYWIQKPDGSTFSLLGDNKVHDIDQINLGIPAALSIRVTSTDDFVKRAPVKNPVIAPVKRRQLYYVPCDGVCPDQSMKIAPHGSSATCGCLFSQRHASVLSSRAVQEPNAYTAIMTKEVCAAMTCINNGYHAALYNPFSRTCWCATPTFVETNPSADQIAV